MRRQVQLRRPTVVYVDTLGSRRADQVGSPNRLVAGRLCDGCRWPDRCRGDGLCWAAEKRDIAAERAAPPSRPWTRERAVEAVLVHVAAHGRVPRRDEWARSSGLHPSSETVKTLFGNWTALLAAAGYLPLQRFGGDPNDYPDTDCVTAEE